MVLADGDETERPELKINTQTQQRLADLARITHTRIWYHTQHWIARDEKKRSKPTQEFAAIPIANREGRSQSIRTQRRYTP